MKLLSCLGSSCRILPNALQTRFFTALAKDSGRLQKCRYCIQIQTGFATRHFNISARKLRAKRNRTGLYYTMSGAMFFVGLSYAAVPLYRMFCQAVGFGGATKFKAHIGDELEVMDKIEDRILTIRFVAQTNKALQWKFKPLQRDVKVMPGDTALAFYTAENLTDRAIIGISTYNVVPYEAGKYFNKIQCFCFEEQQLNPHEEVDMPVFFYIDPEFHDDPQMEKLNEIVLSYTFFESSSDGKAPTAAPHTKYQ